MRSERKSSAPSCGLHTTWVRNRQPARATFHEPAYSGPMKPAGRMKHWQMYLRNSLAVRLYKLLLKVDVHVWSQLPGNRTDNIRHHLTLSSKERRTTTTYSAILGFLVFKCRFSYEKAHNFNRLFLRNDLDLQGTIILSCKIPANSVV